MRPVIAAIYFFLRAQYDFDQPLISLYRLILQLYKAEMKDIENREDIELLVNTFYDKVKADNTIGHIFHKIIGDDWSHHLPIMYSFWETVIFNKAGYHGNPIQKHTEVDKKSPLNQQHYDRWLQLWNETINQLFAGETAEHVKSRAMMMMNLISMKVEMARSGKSIL
jgi:hemoglobin